MPKFSNSSFSKLSTCHLDLQAIFYEVIKNVDCIILEGYRGEVEQEVAFKDGKTKLHYPEGRHNRQPSFAVDVSPYPIEWGNEKRFYWFAGYVFGVAQKLKDEGKITHGLRWGGAWNGFAKFNEKWMLNDLVHFELVD